MDDIKRIYAWLARDLDGKQGVVQAPTDLGVLPLITTDLSQARLYRSFAQRAAMFRGATAKLVAFNAAEVLEEVEWF